MTPEASKAAAAAGGPEPRGPARRSDLLIEALLDPAVAAGLSLQQWNGLLLQARQHGLLGRLAVDLQDAGLFAGAPPKARAHMLSVGIAVQSAQTAVRFEVNRTLRALRGIEVPLLLLKGAAYLHAELPFARGRFVGDLDVMVPREHIGTIEQRLLERGWQAADLDDYDERYYREWTHEIPPLQHPDRDTPIDIHHTIVALTARYRPDAQALLAASLPLADPRVRVLAPADMVLHSGVHLFNDEVGMPLRDLFDLHDLMTHFGGQPGFWDALVERAQLHGLQRPAYYVLRTTRQRLGTPVPDAVWRATAGWAPPLPLRPLMAALFRWRFEPERPIAGPRRATRVAAFLLYLRAHWLRMPPGMLVRHLGVKALRRLRESLPAAPGAPGAGSPRA